MKTSVTKIMMSFALMGCLIIGASDASAQSRSRSQGGSSSSRSQSAAVSRQSTATAPQVSRTSSSSSTSRSSSVTSTPQVNRSSSSTSRSSSVTSTPQVNRSSSSTSRSTASPTSITRSSSSSSSNGSTQVNRGTTTRSGSNGSAITPSGRTRVDGGTGNSNKGTSGTGSTVRHSDSGSHVSTERNASSTERTAIVTNRLKGKGNGNGNGNIKPDDNGGRPGGHDNNGNGNNGGKPDGHGGNGNGHGGHGGGRPGYGNHNHFDYTNHHYHNDYYWNYNHHNWSRPLPPPARPYRPAPLVWYRPVIPAGWHPYAGAPIIDRILGITFGTLFDASLDYLYYNGYEIDGYADHIIYLRNVSLLNLIWDDAMLCYDSHDRLVNAQFIYMSSHYNRYRYNRVYNNLCRVYGQPITGDGESISWYGGNNTGWITLSMHNNMGYYYTTLSIGY